MQAASKFYFYFLTFYILGKSTSSQLTKMVLLILAWIKVQTATDAEEIRHFQMICYFYSFSIYNNATTVNCSLTLTLSDLNQGLCPPDVEIVGQPVSEADRKFLTLQKVFGGSSFLWVFLLKMLKTMIIFTRN